MLTLTSPVDTRLHGLPAGAKLAALAVATVMLMPLEAPASAGVAAAATAALYAAQGGRFAAHGLRMLRPLWPFLLILALWHGWTGEVARGAAIALKLATAVALANLVTMTTRLDAMIAVLERLARPFRYLGLQPHVLAISIALVIRFTPVLLARAERLAEAWRARSPRRPTWRIVVPLALGALDDAEQVAEAIRARGGL
ncbi:energy-coupling factor transporter transmembrane protein EcfT [Cereibacter sphaeroides]|uniref:energy-coupling factor transporter transmembrane component T family protein n=1 Tax=Cereibacter sphaeroides TaxID=1063 RepID=UPI001F489E4F|nr:energy-coupling factor transporter transmembrane component T [Cereibacter sphaeroides]MCE6961261.1 energy-coupling factor transporter transmembrane protein EcfT [Cereibacter sphaeroides]MCE6970247.1 energy-coupling factor transporter transmembrane protein EcfT [Cereibacter sphaeroides]MCE6974014.1 energy-coupling factor transporter transmembrane protein EcfT [Cereibacter sphaeroides]